MYNIQYPISNIQYQNISRIFLRYIVVAAALIATNMTFSSLAATTPSQALGECFNQKYSCDQYSDGSCYQNSSGEWCY